MEKMTLLQLCDVAFGDMMLDISGVNTHLYGGNVSNVPYNLLHRTIKWLDVGKGCIHIELE